MIRWTAQVVVGVMLAMFPCQAAWPKVKKIRVHRVKKIKKARRIN